jgi:CheY-like chemotaxis protein
MFRARFNRFNKVGKSSKEGRHDNQIIAARYKKLPLHSVLVPSMGLILIKSAFIDCLNSSHSIHLWLRGYEKHMARILVIGQEIVMLNLTSSILRQDGHTVTKTSDPMAAIGIVERRACDIDLVLTDVDMTPISGFEFMTHITRKGIDIPILFASNSSNLARVIASTFGDHAVIEKPFDAAALRKRVGRFVTKRKRLSLAGRESGTGIKAPV